MFLGRLCLGVLGFCLYPETQCTPVRLLLLGLQKSLEKCLGWKKQSNNVGLYVLHHNRT